MGGGGAIDIETNSGSHIILVIVENNSKKFNLSRMLKVELDSGNISSIILLQLPQKFKLHEKMFEGVETMDNFRYVVYNQSKLSSEYPQKYPLKGEIKGTIYDLLNTIHATGVISKEMDEYLTSIHGCMTVIEKVVEKLDDKGKHAIAMKLNQPEDEQTWRMAGLILSNAIVFYDLIADRITLNNMKKCKSLDELKNEQNKITRKNLESAWNDVLDYNYNPIFSIAKEILSTLQENAAKTVIDALYSTAVEIRKRKTAGSTTMYGELLQKVIVDRSKLASYYTRPEAAALMSAMALPKPNDSIYNNESIRKYKIADFACGTGMLLQSAYKQLIINYEATKNNENSPARVHHAAMLEKSLIGLDVLPIATHLAVSGLAMFFPEQVFAKTGIKTMPIGMDYSYKKNVKGKMKTFKHYRLGSLDLIKSEPQSTITPSVKQIVGKDDHSVVDKPWSIDECHSHIPDDSCDLIIMNPPFVGDTNQKGKHDGEARAAWAAFGSTAEDQKNMSELEKKKFANTCSNGKAGLATNFVAICDKKLKPGGTMTLIVPSTIAAGYSWKKVRNLINNGYEITVISIAKPLITENEARAFSSDTSMGEVLFFAKKIEKTKENRGIFVSLNERPKNILESTLVAKSINELRNIKTIEKGKIKTEIKIGTDVIGRAMDCPLTSSWKFVSVYDPLLEQIAWKLSKDFQKGNTIFEPGITHRKIVGSSEAPFKNSTIGNKSEIHHALWGNTQNSQLQMIVEPDTCLIKKENATQELVDSVLKTATHVHLNMDPRFTANSLIASYTIKQTLGGSVWPSLIMLEKYQKPFVAWCNTSMGILSYWSMISKQHLGRGRASRSSVRDFLFPDFTSMPNDTLDEMSEIFDKFSNIKLDRMMNLWKDTVRKKMDVKIKKILGYRINLQKMRLRLCLEPTINGGAPSADLLKQYKKVIK